MLGSSFGFEKVSWIPALYRQRNDSLDEARLGMGILFARFMVGSRELPGQVVFQVFVFVSHVGMVAKIVAKGQRAPLFTPAPLDNVHVMTVRPLKRPMEEWTERIVGMRNVNVSNGLKALTVPRDRLKRGD